MKIFSVALTIFLILFSVQAQNFTEPKIILEEVEKWASTYKNLIKVYSIPNTMTVGGSTINYVKISFDVETDKPVPNRLVIANLDGNDLLSTEIAYLFVKTVQNFLTDSLIESILRYNQIFILFAPNPDGLNKVWKGDLKFSTNFNNVSLDSNFKEGWNQSCSGSKDPKSPLYKGPSEASEIEVSAIRSLFQERKFVQVINLKRFTGNSFALSYPRGCVENLLQQTFIDVHKNIGMGLISKFPFPMVLKENPNSGNLILDAFRGFHALSYDLEIDSTGQNASLVSNLSPIINQFLYNIFSINSTIYGQSVNKEGKGVASSFVIENSPLKSDGWTSSLSHTGYFHLWLPNVNVSLIFSKPGHENLIVPVNVPVKTPLMLEIPHIENFYIVVTLFPISFAIFIVNFFILVLYQVYQTVKSYRE